MIKFLQALLGQRVLVLVCAFLLAGAGALSYRELPLDAFPDVSPNLVQVFTLTEGLAPEEIERLVTFPVETAMNGLPGVDHIRSVSNFGLSVVNVYFEDSVDLYFARQLVGERLQEAREQIPEDFGEPQLGPISTGMGQVLFYYLEDTTGRLSLTELRELQDWVIKVHLQNLPGVTEVLGIGGFEKQFEVQVDPHALRRYGITLAEVVDAVRANNMNVGASFIEQGGEELVVRSVGLARGTEDLARSVVRATDGTPIRLGDLANVEIGGVVRRGVQTRDGGIEVVAGQVIKLFGTNSSKVIADVEERLAEIERTLPEGVRIVPYYEQKTLVDACMRTVVNALLQGILLVGAVLFLMLGGARPALVVAGALPFAVLSAILGMRVFGLSANLMSFGGLAIAIGILVDGTIVIVENVERRVRETGNGASLRETVASGAAEVARPVLFAIVILVVVFTPLLTLGGVEGKTFRPLAQTVVLALGGALLYATALSPVLASLLLRRKATKRVPLGSRLLGTAERIYRALLARFIAWPIAALMLALALLGAGFGALPFLGSEFTPALREGNIVVRVSMAPSIALSESQRVIARIERRLIALPEITRAVTRIGRGEVGAHTDPINSGEVYLTLAREEEWEVDSQPALEERIRESLEGFPGIHVNLTQPIAMTVDELLEGVRAELALKIVGDDLARLESLAERAAALLRTVPGAADVQVDPLSGAPQLLLAVDRDATARYGLTIEEVQSLLAAAVGGVPAGELFEGDRRFPILVRYEEGARGTPEEIARILVPTPEGAEIPLSELVSMRRVVGARQVTRENGRRFASVQCNVAGRDIGSFVEDATALLGDELALPPGYLSTWGGQFRLQQAANQRFLLVVPLTLLAVAVLLQVALRRLSSTLLILLNIPLALTGGLIALALSGQNLSVPASVGFIALLGIAIGNGMVLITALDRARATTEAFLDAAQRRLRPVLLTALTTGLGLLPLLLSTGTGSEVQRPLATVVIGGLLSSTLLTLLVVPSLAAALRRRSGA